MTFLLLTLTTLLFAPGSGVATLLREKGINPWKPLIYAIGKEECKHDTAAINHTEQAYGFFQVRPIRLEDYRKRTGIHYTTRDMLDYKKAERVFMYYAAQIGPYDFETIARQWNGSGPMTIAYWNRVKKYL
jgi:hypothetical protein